MTNFEKVYQKVALKIINRCHAAIKISKRGKIIEVYDVLTKNLEKESDIRLDYLKIINYDTLIECEDLIENQFAICIAAYIGDIRLIDNINYLFSKF